MEQTIQNLQNEAGGGLATEVTGLFESCRHALAKQDEELMTAGELAKQLKKLGFDVKAVELVSWFKFKYQREPEWHHAGTLPKSYSGGMKKTYFFESSIIAEFNAEDFAIIERLRAGIPVFRVRFEQYSGKYGRKCFQPVASFVLASKIGKNDTEISLDDFDLLRQFEGRELESYESFRQFKTRVLA